MLIINLMHGSCIPFFCSSPRWPPIPPFSARTTFQSGISAGIQGIISLAEFLQCRVGLGRGLLCLLDWWRHDIGEVILFNSIDCISVWRSISSSYAIDRGRMASRTDTASEAKNGDTSEGVIHKVPSSSSNEGCALLVPFIVVVVGCVMA